MQEVLAGEALLIVACGLLGLVAYLLAARLLRMEELGQIGRALRLRSRV